MAPFTCDDCPVCSKKTVQHFLHVPENGAGNLEVICEICATVLIFNEEGLVGQRPPTEEERALIPERYQPSEEELAQWRADLRQGRLELAAWIRQGCPGLTRTILRDATGLAAALERLGATFPQSD
jgi:hypothetical protein